MKPTLRQLILAFVFSTTVLAQNTNQSSSAFSLQDYLETGMEVAGIRAPYYDEDGELRAQLYGGYAKLLENEVADVTNIRIDVYEKNEIVMTIFAPQCFTEMDEANGQKSLNVYSDGDVLIEMEQMSISGRGFRFNSNHNKFEILEESRVLVKESVRNADGVEL